MTKEELAAQLNGTEYPMRISEELATQAKAARLVVVYGASDDLMELEGAIRDEISAPGSAYVDGKGLTSDFNELCENKDWRGLQDYFQRFDGREEIEALWCAEPSYSWTYKTAIPHATFEVVEDGEPYCRGIVFSLADLGSK